MPDREDDERAASVESHCATFSELQTQLYSMWDEYMPEPGVKTMRISIPEKLAKLYNLFNLYKQKKKGRDDGKDSKIGSDTPSDSSESDTDSE